LLSNFSLTCHVIKTSMRRNLTTAMVFDELVVKGAGALEALTVRAITCCAVTLIPSYSNDTA